MANRRSLRYPKLPFMLVATVLAVAAELLLFACTGKDVPNHKPRPVSHALEAPETTYLGQLFQDRARDHQGRSGFVALADPHEAFLALYALAQSSEKTLDVQYYIWRNDRTGRLLLAALLDAAERGVRVRMLLDDKDLSFSDEELARLNAHPNFEIRLFNPFFDRATGVLDYVLNFSRITHRMHNKAFIADNTVTVLGGRNIGDSYFALERDYHYRDLDLYAAGPIVRQVSASFDEFWNSDWSISVESGVVEVLESPAAEARRRLQEARAAMAETSLAEELGSLSPARHAEQMFERLIWTAEAEVLVDEPNKPETSRGKLWAELQRGLAAHLNRELLVETAYLIPGDQGLKELCALVDSGAVVRILTNSYASNDVISAYSGYRKYRKPLLRCGIRLYEMRADSDPAQPQLVGSGSLANLHTKAAVIDRRYVFVGSFNIDPRSMHLNTEIALLVRSPALAAEVARFIEESMSPQHAYRLELDEEDDIVWLVQQQGETVRLTDEPAKELWPGLLTDALSLLPIESQL